ncbi:hypothetical protein IQ287_29525 [Burkholderia sp. R-69927]|uniref:hypothetical protein n=1 Tax=Paraburkholderia domus TaxID=2793075 RepID=UPI001913FEFF|nr:hypothetical protein [Paraburkholderia domus]MBK5090094.1 hypothetical protein [Burkholderia sp. R-69927]
MLRHIPLSSVCDVAGVDHERSRGLHERPTDERACSAGVIKRISFTVLSRLLALRSRCAVFKPLRSELNIAGLCSDIGELADSSSTDANVLSNILVPSAA